MPSSLRETISTIVCFPPIADIQHSANNPLMLRISQIAMITLFGIVAACESGLAPDGATAAEIERQVVAAHPGLSLKRFARFYAREANGSIRAVYLFASEGYEPIEGKAGVTTWTDPEKLPVVEDGGCAVIALKYDPARKKLTAFECNGDVTDAPIPVLPPAAP